MGMPSSRLGATMDKGYKGAEIDGVQILRSGQRRGVTRTMKAMIKRRGAIEPTIRHMRAWMARIMNTRVHQQTLVTA